MGLLSQPADLFSQYQPWSMALAVFVLVALAIPVLRFVADKVGLVDQPGGRKQHDGAVPLVGGLAIFPIFIGGLILNGNVSETWPLIVSILLLLITGAVDDRMMLPAKFKFFVQFAAAFIIVLCGAAKVTKLGDLFGFGPFGLNFISIPFSIIATVLLINAINLMDGLDGLSGGIGALIFGFLSYAAIGAGSALSAQTLMLLAALLAFLCYNMRTPLRSKASVFIGDAGSLSLGLVIAWYSMTLASYSVWAIEPMSVAWVLALPIFDICGQFARRMRLGQHPFTPDRFHFHHHFINAGVSAGKAVCVILMICMVFGAFGVFAPKLGVPIWVLTVSWITLLLAHIFMSLKPERFQNLIGRFVA